MKPEEFWNCEYRFMNNFIQINMIKSLDNFKRQFTLLDATTDKMIKADAMSNKRPKVISLKQTFAKLYKEEPKIKYQSPEEQIKRLRKLK